VTEIACGGEHMLCITIDDKGTTTVYSWGHNKGTSAASSVCTFVFGGVCGVFKVFANMCRASVGQLGLGDTTARNEPTVVEALRGKGATKIGAGWNFSFVATGTRELAYTVCVSARACACVRARVCCVVRNKF